MKSIHLMKNVGRFTPPQNRQVRFTLKSPSPIYPQIVFGDLPPPEIAKSDLPSNRLSDRRFEGKLDLAILGGGKSSNTFHQVNTFYLLS